MEEKKTFLKEWAERLEQLDTQIAQLQAKAQKAGAESKDELARHMEALSTSEKAARQQLAQLKASQEEQWEALKTEAENRWNELGKSLEKIRRILKEWRRQRLIGSRNRETAKMKQPIRPMLATLVAEPFNRPGWTNEEKYLDSSRTCRRDSLHGVDKGR